MLSLPWCIVTMVGLGFSLSIHLLLNTLRPRQNGCHFPNYIFKRIILNENVWISIKISLKFVPKGPINNIPSLVKIMAWRRSGDKPLSEPMMPRSDWPTLPHWAEAFRISRPASDLPHIHKIFRFQLKSDQHVFPVWTDATGLAIDQLPWSQQSILPIN